MGAGRFVDDVVRPGAAHLGVVRAVHAHARIRAIHLTAVRRAPGVVAAWSAADLPEVARTIAAAWGGSHKGRPFGVPILAGDRVRYVGEPIAVVIAESAQHLADALDAVRVDYEPLPALTSVEASATSATHMHDGWADNTTLPVSARVGDAEAAFARAEVIVGGRFRHPRLAAVPIETRGAVAWPEAETGALVIWASIQNPYRLRDSIASALAVPAESVRVLTPDVGGGFGPKGDVYPDEILVAAAARRLGRPVRWSESRREDFATLGHDRDQVHDARLGLDPDGRIVALETSFLADVGAYPAQGDGLTLNTVNHLPGPYRVPAYRGSGSSVVTTKTLNAAYRAAGRPEAVFVMERLMDLAARRLGLDPAELRRRNLVRPEEMPYRPGLVYKDGMPVTYDPGDFPAAFERALTLLDYDGWRRRQKAQAGGARRLGVGVACYAQGTGLGPYEGATVRIDPSGKVYVLIGVSAQGQGHATTLAQVAATELGASFDDVVVVGGDTERFPIGMGTGGSRVMVNSGPAVAGAAREVRAKAARVAAELLECAADDVRIEASRAFVAGMPDRSLPLGRLAHVAVKSKALRGHHRSDAERLHLLLSRHRHLGVRRAGRRRGGGRRDRRGPAGRLRDRPRPRSRHQSGHRRGPAAGRGRPGHRGRPARGDRVRRRRPAADRQPDGLRAAAGRRAAAAAGALDEHRSAINPLGVKGVGESGAIPGAAAIANAIEDAVADLGVTIHEVPVTPARLWTLLAAARDGRG